VPVVELKSTRDAYGDALVTLGEEKKEVVVLDADLSVSTKTNKFANKYPERFFNAGCAEQNLIGTAAGLAITGKIPFSSTYAIFSNRAWEQIRNTVAHDNLNVKIAVSHAGLTNGPDGASHQSLEDIALMRVIPNMTVIVPADAIEAEKAVISEAYRAGPAYIRLNRVKTPIFFDEDYEFRNGKAVRLMDGQDLTIIATGTMVSKALDAAKRLREKDISACVLNVHTIKPIDKESIINSAKETGAIVTVEEHSVHGGLGGAVAEVLVENYPVQMKIIGVNDKFGESGEYDELIKKYGLTSRNIVKSTKELLEKKR
jgi:transketolase